MDKFPLEVARRNALHGMIAAAALHRTRARRTIERGVGGVGGPGQKFYSMKKLIAHWGPVPRNTPGPSLALDGPVDKDLL